MILLSKILISLGLIFFLGTVVGVLRFPDFYTRMHAAGKGDTLSTILILLGVICHILSDGHIDKYAIILSLKVALISGFIMIGSPTATHAIMDAGYRLKVAPWKRGGKK